MSERPVSQYPVSQEFRTGTGGRIDRTKPLSFEYEGALVNGFAGDTLASALLANGVHEVTTSIKFGRPRGIAAAGSEDPSGLVQIETPFPDPMQLATMIELAPGITARGLPGQGTLAHDPDPSRYDTAHLHVDVVVIGGGPAGLVAASTAARAGARVALVDEQATPGGSLLSRPAAEAAWIEELTAELRSSPSVTLLPRTTAFGLYDDGLALAVERRTDHLGITAPADSLRQRVWRIRAKHTIVAAGAHERPVVFADNDRPGILLAGSARTYLNRYGVRIGEQVAVFTTNDSAYTAAFELHDAGIRIASIVDSRAAVGEHWLGGARERGIRVHEGSVVTGTAGETRVEEVSFARFDGESFGVAETVAVDSLLVSGGWNPAVHLYSQAGGIIAYDETLGGFAPDALVDGLSVVGSAAGRFELSAVLDHAFQVASGVLAGLGLDAVPSSAPVVEADLDATPGDVLWFVPTDEPSRLTTHFVDLQRDATVADIARAIGAGMRSVEHIKRYTTIGTAHDQGKTSGVITSGIAAVISGGEIAALGTTKFRPPYTPVAFATLAGRSRGELFDPVRVTAVHDWHVLEGAEFEDVGQWKRPWYYPQAREDIHSAVDRECRAVRGGVGIMDGSTLGKIDVSGADAATFLDLMYTNLMSSLKVGSIRYGVMCGVDGMVIDDGTVLRIAENRFLVYTTTGGAAKILEWFEEWHQTEWPGLSVRFTSVTEHWSTFPVAGPLSRSVVGDLFPDVDVSNDAFPFMTWRDTELDGVPVRLARVSFSGELAYEVSTSSWFGLDLWERLIEAGRPYGITPYGTETMHVLRAEKGYPIIGQDTDGTVTPHDLGMSWAVSKKKVDFVGKRSFARPQNSAGDRRQFVGILPDDRVTFLPEGSQLVSVDSLETIPVPMDGFVTSSYTSAALGRPFALALVDGGHARIGESINAVVDGRLVPSTITSHVLFDPEGARRDG